MATRPTGLPVRRSFGQTMRTDAWWIQPLVVFTVFTAFVIYSTWAAFQGAFYWHENLLSPFYSPEIWGPSEHALMERSGPPGWWPGFLPYSPAFLILWAPVSFRLTCYYYRGAYYKAYWPGPSSCSVGTPRKEYMGERKFPLVLQNLHRYALPFALLLLVFLAYDAGYSFWFSDGNGGKEFGVSVGTIVLTLNVIFLSGYTLGCHSLRHLVGGGIDLISRRPIRKAAYDCVSCLNGKHMAWAWTSLLWVAFSDIYVRLCSMGVWTNVRFF